MLEKGLRLTKNKEFDSVFKEGKSSYGHLLGIKVKKNELEYNRYGLLLSTKVSKLATIRNKYKRRIKAILFEENKKIKQGFDMVVIVFPLILNKKNQEVQSEIKNILTKLKFYI
jgi:ribonuclease P protein component